MNSKISVIDVFENVVDKENKYIYDIFESIYDPSIESISSLKSILYNKNTTINENLSELYGALLYLIINDIFYEFTNHTIDKVPPEIIIEKIKILLKNGANVNCKNHPLINKYNCFGKLIIHNVFGSFLPVEYKCIMLRLLLDHGANPNSQDDFGYTPIHYILHNMPTEDIPIYIDILLEYGADLNIRNKSYNTPLSFYLKTTPIIHMFLYKTQQNIIKDRYKIIKYLLDNGADVNGGFMLEELSINHENYSYLYTPLYYAVSNNNKKLVELLLEYGAFIETDHIEKEFSNNNINKYIIELLKKRIEELESLSQYFKRAKIEEEDESDKDSNETEMDDI